MAVVSERRFRVGATFRSIATLLPVPRIVTCVRLCVSPRATERASRARRELPWRQEPWTSRDLPFLDITPGTGARAALTIPYRKDIARSDSGAERDRTVDLLNAIQALSQLSYSPTRRPRRIARGS